MTTIKFLPPGSLLKPETNSKGPTLYAAIDVSLSKFIKQQLLSAHPRLKKLTHLDLRVEKVKAQTINSEVEAFAVYMVSVNHDETILIAATDIAFELDKLRRPSVGDIISIELIRGFG